MTGIFHHSPPDEECVRLFLIRMHTNVTMKKADIEKITGNIQITTGTSFSMITCV